MTKREFVHELTVRFIADYGRNAPAYAKDALKNANLCAQSLEEEDPDFFVNEPTGKQVL